MIQLYDSFRNTTSTKSILIEKYQELVRDGYKIEELIEARKFKHDKPMYKQYKGKRLCCTMNFWFNGKKDNTNISHATGYLLYDIDLVLDKSKLDMNKIFMMHKSFGGVNHYIIVKVNGLTLENFSDVYNGIGDELGLTGIFDKGAKKATQYMLISYDPDIYINNDSKIFEASKYEGKHKVYKEDKGKSDIGLNVPLENKSEISDKEFLYELNNPVDLFTSDYSNNINPGISAFKREYSGWNINNENSYNTKSYNYYSEGITTATLFIRKNIPHGKQHNYLCSICQNLMGLNPNRTIEEYTLKMQYIVRYANILIRDEDLDRIINNYFSYLISGRLQLNCNTKKKFIFNSKYDGNKKAVCNKIIGKARSTNTLERIILMYKEVSKTEKPLQRIIAKRLKISIKTVQRYWSQVIKSVKTKKKSYIKKEYFVFNEIVCNNFVLNTKYLFSG